MMGGDRLQVEKKCSGGVDRISNLPDEILADIMSFVSIKEAASTSVLSSRWSDLWKHIPTLNLDLRILVKRWRFGFPRPLFIEWVNSVCDSHDVDSLKRLRIDGYIENSEQHAVSRWLEYAATCKSLEALELDFRCLNRKHCAVLDEEVVKCRCMYKCLKELRFTSFVVRGEGLKLLLHCCPLLERLIINRTDLATDVEIRSASLKHLNMKTCRGRNSIRVAAPNLTCLIVNHLSYLLLLENVPRLVEANLAFANEVDDTVQRFGLALFGCFSQLQTLTLALDSPKAYLASTFPKMPKLKKLKVIYAGKYDEGLIPVTRFIWASPFLVEFHFEWCWLGGDKVGVPINMARFGHQHLKVLEISRFPYGKHIEDLVEFISNGCLALEKIIIRLCSVNEYYDVKKHLHVNQRLQPKLPPHVQLLVKVRALPKSFFSKIHFLL